MKIKMQEIPVSELVAGYLDSQENGVVGYHGRLDIRPPFQREFIYKEQQRDEVLRTIRKGFPLNVMYWSVAGTNEAGEPLYELLDGQQRTVSICQYVDGDFSLDSRGFANLTEEERQQIRDYKLSVYVCEGTELEKLEWFKIVNIAGLKLEEQELRNAIYTGSWLADAKKKFSKTACVAHRIANNYINGELNRQAYLEVALLWIADRDNMSIEDYMAAHQHDDNADELWEYFRAVIKWVETVFPTPAGKKPRKEMKGIKWGFLYNKYAATFKTSLEAKVAALMADEEVTSKKGIYEYLLDGQEKHLSIRVFLERDKRSAYEKQKGKCPLCGKKFELSEMHADHIKPWSKGGKTVAANCQMLCTQCNIKKSNK